MRGVNECGKEVPREMLIHYSAHRFTHLTLFGSKNKIL